MARRAALATLGSDTEVPSELRAEAQGWRPGFAATAFELALGAATEMRLAHDPRLLLELLVVRLAALAGPAPRPEPRAAAPEPAPAAESAPEVEPAPEPAEAAAPPEPSAAPTPVDGALAEVQARWPNLLEALRGSAAATRVKALLAGGRPVELQGDELTLAFRVAIHSEKAQEPLNRQALEKALSDVYGQTFRLNFRVEPGLEATRDAATSTSSASAGGDEASGVATAEAAVEVIGGRITDVRMRQGEA
jgi:DNA polymerase III gamma/tau subunit